MVFGLPIAVTAVPSVYQCADTHKMALGFGIELPSRREDSVYWLRSRVFLGLPWPKKTTGILDLVRCMGCLYARSNSRTSASFAFSSTISAVPVALRASPA